MSIFKRSPKAKDYSYRFVFKGVKYGGVCFGCTTVKEAEHFEKNIRAGLSRAAEATDLQSLYEKFKDALMDANPVPLTTAYDKALQKPHRRTPGDRRAQNKRNYWNDFVFFMQRRYPNVTYMQKVTPAIAENYIGLIRKYGLFQKHFNKTSDSKLSNATCNEIHAVMIQVFDALRHDTNMQENPFKHIEKLPSDSDGHEAYTLDELQKIFANADDFVKPLFMIGLFSGLRLGDLCTLRKDEISFERHFISRPQRKTGHWANIPMHPFLENYLVSLLEKSEQQDTEYVLPEHAKLYFHNPSAIENSVRLFLTKLGIQTTKKIPGRTRAVNVKGIHSLRHTFCSIAGVCGIPETVVRSIVGHMTPKMTQLYNRHVEDADKLRCIQLFGQKLQNALPISPMDKKQALLERICTLSDDQINMLLDHITA